MGFGTARRQIARIETAASPKHGPVPAGSAVAPGARGLVSPSPPNPAAKLKSFEETALPHLNAAYNLARWLTRNEHDAQDVVQESYLRAFRFFDSYKGGDGKAWLLAVVRNTYLTWRQRAKRAMETVLPDNPEFREHAEQNAQSAAPSALDRLVAASKIHALKTCIEQLPADYREVLVMRELEEMSYKQISEVANLPVGTVMSRLSRARKRLAECVIGKTAGAISGAGK